MGVFRAAYVVYQQAARWVEAGVFETMAHDLRRVLRLLEQREPEPTAAIFDARVLQSSPESGARAGYDGHKRRKGSKVHVAVDTLGHLLAIKVTAANEQERQQAGDLAQQVQEATGETVSLAYVDQGYTGEAAALAAKERGIDLLIVAFRKPNAASFSCLAAGSLNALSLGPPASVASSVTTSAPPLPPPDTTGSPSSLSCLAPLTSEVHNSL